ncbi:MobF family relaxase [Crateriforma conspicua]|uniref:MobF family relaxase n=1 Tax=Crateriforma conspicua TaxID=2527996 RepID=UPI00118CC3E1|nr:MobF family relaxase [Crateriforma conspicua]QDV62011.1 Multifunctional conjugation protein TraI [Crateriforma conspicua]
MVSTISVISGSVAAAGAYYVSLYYPGQEQGVWFGEATLPLGLSGRVRESDFQKLLCGQSLSGSQLVKPVQPTASEDKKKQKKNVLGLDITDSAPKELSVLWACSDRRRQLQIEKCVLRASEKKNRWIEKNLNLARRGRNGQNRISANLVGAQFLHTLNRAGEPQLHVHNVFSHMVYGKDGRWSKVNTKQLHTWTPALGRIFRANLARELTKELGLALVRPVDSDGKQKSWFTLADVPKELADANSSRRQAILDAAGSQGEATGKYAALVRQHAAYNTRDSKDHDINPQEVFDRVRRQADELGFSSDKRDRLLCRSQLPQEHVIEGLYEKAFPKAFTKLTEEVAHFRECDIVREVVEELQHVGVDGSELATRVIDDIPHRPELIQLQTYQGEKQFTTKKMWELEARLLDDVQVLRGRTGATLSRDAFEALLSKNPSLFDEQKEASLSLLTGNGAIRLLTGEAGSGKSTTLEFVREAFEKHGYRVVGGALAGATTQDLAQKTGMPCRTVASYLFHLDKTKSKEIQQTVSHHAQMISRTAMGKQTWAMPDHRLDSKTVLILDEAGMLSTKDLSRITRIVRDAKATLILTGDVAQLPAIGAGTPLRRLAEETPHSHLKTNLRQQDPNDRAAVSQLRNGDAATALQNYAARGRLVIGDGNFDTALKLVETWKDAGGPVRPDRHTVLTQTRSEARLVNALCQSERLATVTQSSVRSIAIDNTKFFEGDRVLFHKPLRRLGIENGHFAKIVSIDVARQTVAVRLERERTPTERAKGLGQTVNLRLSDIAKDSLTLGFAATAHKLQGATVDHSYVLLSGPLSSKEMAYVQATRARFSTHLFADRTTAGKDLERLEKALTRSREKKLAHDLGKQPSISQSFS